MYLLIVHNVFFCCYSGANTKDVPYSRLIDASPVAQLPQKLDSDSKLNTERSKSILSVPEIETAPKSSVSDSKLAVDYFTATENVETLESNSPQSLPTVPTEFTSTRSTRDDEGVNVSDSHHSLYARTNSEERLKQEVEYKRCLMFGRKIVAIIFITIVYICRYNVRYPCRLRITRKRFIRPTKI